MNPYRGNPFIDHLEVLGPVMCPQCHSMNAGNTEIEAPAAQHPHVGDISVCWHCFGVSVFETATRARLLTKAELDRIPEIRDDAARLARASVARVMAE